MKKYFVFALAIMATMFVACSDDDKEAPEAYYSWAVVYADEHKQLDSHSYGCLDEWEKKVEEVTAPYCGFATYTSDEEAFEKADILEEQLVKLEQDFLKAKEEMDLGSGKLKKSFFTVLKKEKDVLKAYANHTFDYESPTRLYAKKVYAPENFANTLEQNGTITVEEHYSLDDLNLKDGVEFSLNGDAKVYNAVDHYIYKGLTFVDVKAVSATELVVTYTFNKDNIKDYQSTWNILVPVKMNNAEDMDNCLLLLDVDLQK